MAGDGGDVDGDAYQRLACEALFGDALTRVAQNLAADGAALCALPCACRAARCAPSRSLPLRPLSLFASPSCVAALALAAFQHYDFSISALEYLRIKVRQCSCVVVFQYCSM